MVWNGLEMIRNGSSSKIGFSVHERSNVHSRRMVGIARLNVRMWKPANDLAWGWCRVRTFILNVRTRACSDDWRGSIERSHVHSERSNVRDLGRWETGRQMFERSSHTFERLTALVCWPGARELELSL